MACNADSVTICVSQALSLQVLGVACRADLVVICVSWALSASRGNGLQGRFCHCLPVSGSHCKSLGVACKVDFVSIRASRAFSAWEWLARPILSSFVCLGHYPQVLAVACKADFVAVCVSWGLSASRGSGLQGFYCCLRVFVPQVLGVVLEKVHLNVCYMSK